MFLILILLSTLSRICNSNMVYTFKGFLNLNYFFVKDLVRHRFFSNIFHFTLQVTMIDEEISSKIETKT